MFSICKVDGEFFEQSRYKKITDALNNHYGKSIIFSEGYILSRGFSFAKGTQYNSPDYGLELEEDDLLSGELSASVYQIGYYTVRYAHRLYKTPTGNLSYQPEKETVADKLDVDYFRKNELNVNKQGKAILGGFYGPPGTRPVYEISAYHNLDTPNTFKSDFKLICRAAGSKTLDWKESIMLLCKIKMNSEISDEHAHLLVQKQWVGSSSTVDYWYMLDPQGVVEEIKINGYS